MKYICSISKHKYSSEVFEPEYFDFVVIYFTTLLLFRLLYFLLHYIYFTAS